MGETYPTKTRGKKIVLTFDNKEAQLTQGLHATAPSFQGGRQPPS